MCRKDIDWKEYYANCPKSIRFFFASVGGFLSISGIAMCVMLYSNLFSPLASDAPVLTEADRTISVSGSGVATITNDAVSFSFSVENRGEDKADVQKVNEDSVNTAIKVLMDAGIKESAIKTDWYNVGDYWDRSIDDYSGYEATHSISVSDVEIEVAEQVMAALGKIDNVIDISKREFTASDSKDAYTDALKAAMEDARQKADVLAEANGVTIKGVSYVYENSSYQEPRYYKESLNLLAASNATADSVTLEAGESEVKAEISVTYIVE